MLQDEKVLVGSWSKAVSCSKNVASLESMPMNSDSSSCLFLLGAESGVQKPRCERSIRADWNSRDGFKFRDGSSVASPHVLSLSAVARSTAAISNLTCSSLIAWNLDKFLTHTLDTSLRLGILCSHFGACLC